jgi:hypothetical protein
VPAVAVLHENARDVAHGLIAPERLIVTPNARLVIVEHVLGAAIEQTGYYPAVVREGVMGAVAGEHVVSFLVHHEPTIDRDEVRRHITVVVLTPTRLILCHTDEHAPDDLLPEPYTSTSTEAISLSSVRSVVVNRMVANPATFVGAGDFAAGPVALCLAGILLTIILVARGVPGAIVLSIAAITLTQNAMGVRLPPAKFAESIAIVYDHVIETGGCSEQYATALIAAMLG